jgi:(2Fe-2S) ferredoxin
MTDYYQQHLFFCTNLRTNGKQCCEQANASHYREYAKQRIRDLNLSGAGGVRVNQSGCLGRCSEGPSLVIYPDGVWYTYQSEADIDEILQSHLIDHQVVTRLLMAER